MGFTRWVLLLLAGTTALGQPPAPDRPFDFEALRRRAKELAGAPYVARPTRVPAWLRSLSYDDYRRIEFIHDRGIWRHDQLPYRLEFFHPGFINDRTVQVAQIEHGMVRPIPYEAKMFRFGEGLKLGQVPSDLGFSGFRVLHPLNAPNAWDELVVFQGASYFRALGRDQRYGLSARGLALNTGDARGEEFPFFEEFWVERPAADAKEIVVYALLDGPSAAGAFRFAIRPGVATIMDVQASLQVRPGASIRTLGLAPLTSMFWHGESSARVDNDYRPEVHDSDGLLMESGSGEWLWRPLTNPTAVRIVSFADENPRGFGLVQRDRKFSSYEDLEACYHQRPSAWVEPVGKWGKGQVRLVEIPTPDETNDNIVAFWVPETPPDPHRSLEYAYRLSWFTEGREGSHQPPAGQAVATRLGRSKTHEPELQRFIIDFDGANLQERKEGSKVDGVLNVRAGATLIHEVLQRNPYNGSWRMAFALRPDGSGKPVELRCFLREASHVLTETWTYLWQP